jgi:hydrogenase expression/formation protein HypE
MVRAGIGRDAAVIRHGGSVLVFSTDPVTGTATHIGAHSVIVNANDIATTGARPIWYLCIVLLPPGAKEGLLRQIMVEIDRESKKLGIEVVGGHSEITAGLTRPIIAGFMVGEGKLGRIMSAEGGQVGDSILFTKTAGIEGTAILASDYRENLRVSQDVLAEAKRLSQNMSVVKEALAIAKIPGVHAMHDPTEGGVLNGLWELAQASGLGIEAWADRISVLPSTRQICSVLGLDPLKLMSSGSLLVATRPSAVKSVVQKMEKMRIPVTQVGVLSSKGSGRLVFRNEERKELIAVPRDELYRLG